MFTFKHFKFISSWLTVLLAGLLLLSACSSTDSTVTQPNPTATSAPVATVEPTVTLAPTETMAATETATIAPIETATMAPTETAVPTPDDSLQISLDTGSVATGFQTETIAAVPAGDAPYWEMLPEYTQLTLQGYPISNHLMTPQIFINLVAELKVVNEGAEPIVTSPQTLLQSPQEIPTMPFLPLFNAQQVMHAHVQYLDFQSGLGAALSDSV